MEGGIGRDQEGSTRHIMQQGHQGPELSLEGEDRRDPWYFRGGVGFGEGFSISGARERERKRKVLVFKLCRVLGVERWRIASAGESKERIARCMLCLAHQNASREREHAMICYFLWRDAIRSVMRPSSHDMFIQGSLSHTKVARCHESRPTPALIILNLNKREAPVCSQSRTSRYRLYPTHRFMDI